MPVTAAATFCATLVDEWARAGVTMAFVAPGSRSTPLALALAGDARFGLEVHLDERCAAFMALGWGIATGRPAVALCTSGTAAAHFHAAVIEAHQSDVPMIVCTADRPPELRDVAAPQTIDQLRLYGPVTRWFHDAGVPDPAIAHTWRTLGARAVAEATGPRPGPVHLNLAFREPLVGEPGQLPDPRPGDAAWVRPLKSRTVLDDDAVQLLDERRGIIIAGRGSPPSDRVHALASRLGWPVLADPLSGCRVPRPATVAAFDPVLRNERFRADHRPAVVLRFGAPPASRVLAEWITSAGAPVVAVAASPAWTDPDATVALRVTGDPSAFCDHLVGTLPSCPSTPWLARWRRAEDAAQRVLSAELGTEDVLSEAGVARTVVGALPDGAQLHVSSSMPVRDVEWFSAPREDLAITANRGANGIDGVVSTAVGLALARRGRPTGLLVGDVAFLHDANGMLGLARRSPDLVIIVVDNDGGGIFSFLPQARLLPGDRFELLFGTPHGVDLGALAAVHGISCHDASTRDELRAAIGARGGPRIVRVVTDRQANVDAHSRLYTAVSEAIDAVR